jgi:hypothetical protein
MPSLKLGTIELTNDSFTAEIFRRCLHPLRGRNRKRVSVYLDIELLEEYEKLHPRRENGSFGGQLSDDLNKSLAVWLQAHGMI